MTANTKSAAEEKAEILLLLEQTREQVISTIRQFPAVDIEASPGEGRWSVLQTLEHMGVAEEAILQRWHDEAKPGTADRANDEALKPFLLDRKTYPRVAVEAMNPRGGTHSLADALEHFVSARARTITAVRQMPPEDLRGKTLPHRVLGTADGYQLFHIIALHGVRHLDQMKEAATQLNAR